MDFQDIDKVREELRQAEAHMLECLRVQALLAKEVSDALNAAVDCGAYSTSDDFSLNLANVGYIGELLGVYGFALNPSKTQVGYYFVTIAKIEDPTKGQGDDISF